MRMKAIELAKAYRCACGKITTDGRYNPMKPESFDLPYGPIASTIRTLSIPVIVVAMIGMAAYGAWSVSAHRRAEFPIKDSDVAHRMNQYADSIYLARGVGGPYKEGPGVTGVVGGGIQLNVRGQSVECPAVPGSHYSASSFINKEGKAYVLVLLLKDTQGSAVAAMR